MRVTIHPHALSRSQMVKAPPSKSMAHREIICAGLAEGVSRIGNAAMSQDILATMDCLGSMGASIQYSPEDMILEIGGTDPLTCSSTLMPCRESGSTLRFMIPVAALSEGVTELTGSGRLMLRPLSVYEDILGAQGLLAGRTERGLSVRGCLKGGEFSVPGDISSQFVSGLLFALPVCREDSIIRLRGAVESRPYIDMTISVLNEHGVEVFWEDGTTIRVRGCQRYMPADTVIEGDWSNGAYLMGLGVSVTGLDDNSLQGDRVCSDCFRTLDNGRAGIDIADCPDLGPVLMAYAAMRNGAVFTGTRRLRYKESDRGRAMKEELSKFGIDTVIEDNSITVGCGVKEPSEVLSGHNDHRIVMALAAICSVTGGTIEGAEAVSKSFPDYFDRLNSLGVELEKEE